MTASTDPFWSDSGLVAGPSHSRTEESPAVRVQAYSDLVGERFDLGRVLPGGRALEISSSDGTRCVLKWDEESKSIDRRYEAIANAEELGRLARWPVPSFVLAEDESCLFVRQTLMPGTAVTRVTGALAEQVINLVDAASGLGAGASSDWPERLVDTLVAEPAQPTVYCSHRPLREHSDTGRGLVERIEAIGAATVGTDLGGANDLMHWDLHPGNLLVDGDRISAVIDLDNAGAGPGAFDLITFSLSSQLISTNALTTRLLAAARERAGESLYIAAVAHLVLRFANWGLRTGHGDEAEFWVSEGNRRLAP